MQQQLQHTLWRSKAAQTPGVHALKPTTVTGEQTAVATSVRWEAAEWTVLAMRITTATDGAIITPESAASRKERRRVHAIVLVLAGGFELLKGDELENIWLDLIIIIARTDGVWHV